MKRVKAACILQTLVFSQREELDLGTAQAMALNRDEFAKYKAELDRTHTRYQIVDVAEQADGSIVVRIRKQYNDKADVSEYFA